MYYVHRKPQLPAGLGGSQSGSTPNKNNNNNNNNNNKRAFCILQANAYLAIISALTSL